MLKRMPFLSRFEKIHNWELEKTSAWWNVATRRITAPELFIKSKIKNDITAKN